MRIIRVTVMFLVISLFAVADIGAEDSKRFFAGNKIGVGYQGVISGNLINGISVRGWRSKFAWDASIMQLSLSSDDDLVGDLSAFAIDARILYPIRHNKNSHFYLGGELGVGMIDLGAADGSLFILGPLIGSEFFFTELPEIGFNWEVGYKILHTNVDVDGSDIDFGINGFTATVGVHYYL